jgi:starch phosphorylase
MTEFDYGSLPQTPEGIGYLEELAFDLRNTWEHGADDIWRRLEPEVWAATHNPRVVLQTVARTRLRNALADPEFLEMLTRVVLDRRRAAQAPSWFKRTYPQAPLTCAAYFSMEFGLSEALPIYSGGLGNVAGDQLKAAHDLGVPVVGVGLLYQQGYFRQYIDQDGNQTALFPYNDPGQLPITPVRNADGEWIRLRVRVAGPTVWLRAWEARVGRVKLYLLDSNDPANGPVYRGVTSELYGGGKELRLQQELVLGLGTAERRRKPSVDSARRLRSLLRSLAVSPLGEPRDGDCPQRSEFELPVPVSKLPDDSIMLSFATSRRVVKCSHPGPHL